LLKVDCGFSYCQYMLFKEGKETATLAFKNLRSEIFVSSLFFSSLFIYVLFCTVLLFTVIYCSVLFCTNILDTIGFK
jgi:hypothetical protein